MPKVISPRILIPEKNPNVGHVFSTKALCGNRAVRPCRHAVQEGHELIVDRFVFDEVLTDGDGTIVIHQHHQFDPRRNERDLPIRAIASFTRNSEEIPSEFHTEARTGDGGCLDGFSARHSAEVRMLSVSIPTGNCTPSSSLVSSTGAMATSLRPSSPEPPSVRDRVHLNRLLKKSALKDVILPPRFEGGSLRLRTPGRV